MNEEVIQSAGGIIYYIDSNDNEPRFLIIKRYALSNRIERVAPKGKVQEGEKMEDTVLREIGEEVGIPINRLIIKRKMGTIELRNPSNKIGWIEKDITYFLVEYTGEPEFVHVDEVEGYIGVYKWATIQEILGLIYFQNIRELFRNSYKIIKEQQKSQNATKNFINKFID